MSGEIQMFVRYGFSAFRSADPVFPMATRYQLIVNYGKQIWLKTSTKKRNRIRKTGIIGISIMMAAMLIILGKIS